MNRESGKPALIIGPTCLTQRKTKTSYAVFANYLRDSLVGMGIDISSNDWSFNFVTDGEVALYEAFRKAFPRHQHTLCVLHVRKNIESYLEGRNYSSSKTAYVLNAVFGYSEVQNDRKKHVLGLIDSESVEEFRSKFSSLLATLSDELFGKWFRQHHESKFVSMLILPVRQALGFSRDLPHTNFAEAMHKAMKAFFGKYQDPRVLVEKLLKLYADDIVCLFEALKSQGRHVIRKELTAEFLISRELCQDVAHVKSKLRKMFPECNIDAMVLVASKRQVCFR